MSGLTKEPAVTIKSASAKAWAPRTVIRSQAPGPAPTNITSPFKLSAGNVPVWLLSARGGL
ncbi:MAG: hypothetical protein LBV23_00470 [Deltaproteobacteria bacterium]|nr:hypothetical protein [Deltaproteobacteria bacterium]